ncbi:centromere-associated protein E-like, partial [Hyalella azteca]|uniref:Centromere-associated protein E-like n=1 Tax=Hyalella azteca TaxID=294128 RepID=A0A8B7NQD6_HYAAZ
MSDNIKVVVRVRPPLAREEGETLHWKVTGEDSNSLMQVTAHDKNAATFSFDKVFDQTADNEKIFTEVMQPIVEGALNGINGTVFAYGQTSSDLLVGRSNIPGNKGLVVREDTSGNIHVPDLREECVNNQDKLLSMMHRGDRNRQVGCTNMNDRSSRSHTIFRIIVESQTAIDGDNSLEAGLSEDDVAVTVSHLNL